jgi:hypothetical protein
MDDSCSAAERSRRRGTRRDCCDVEHGIEQRVVVVHVDGAVGELKTLDAEQRVAAVGPRDGDPVAEICQRVGPEKIAMSSPTPPSSRSPPDNPVSVSLPPNAWMVSPGVPPVRRLSPPSPTTVRSSIANICALMAEALLSQGAPPTP